MLKWKTHRAISREWFFQPESQPVLVTAGNEGRTSGEQTAEFA
jgi:hypothetical protein